MTRLFNRVPPAGTDPRAVATELNRIIEYLENRARIQIKTRQVIIPTLLANQWVVLPLQSIEASVPPLNMELASDRITYTGGTPSGIFFSIAYAVDWAGAAQIDIGLRKNGVDAGIVPYRVAQFRSEFSTPYPLSIDMAAGDYVELVWFGTAQIANATANGLIYAENGKFLA